MSKAKKMNAFMLNDIIKFNIDELVTFIEDNYPSIDISNIRKSYIYVEPNGNNLENVLKRFIISKVDELGEGGDDIESSINENIDIFFDITEKSEGLYIVERMKNN